MQFLLSAGEASGDTYGAQLAEALRPLAPGASFFGMGGEKMRAAGCELLVDARDIAVVGLVEVVRHLPAIRRRFRHLVAEAARRRPTAAVLIDFPDFNLRLARELHRLGIPVFYFVSPQIWAWRTGRVRQIQKYVRKMIVIFPFEQEFYRRHGVEVSYVGHPLAYAAPPQVSRRDFARRHGLDPAKQWIALLPGSRRKEVRLNLPPMAEAATRLRETAQRQQPGLGFEFLLPVASTLSAGWMREQLAGSAAAIHLTADARATLMHARAAVVASGTATVEAALSGTPFVVVYRLAPLTWLLGRRLVRLDTFAMPNLIAGRKDRNLIAGYEDRNLSAGREDRNLIAGREDKNLSAGRGDRKKIVPELIQRDFTAENVVRELEAILPDGPARQEMQNALKIVQDRLRDPQNQGPPALKAAREIMAGIGQAVPPVF